MKWYLREVSGVLLTLFAAIGLLIWAINEASGADSGTTVLTLGLVGGAIPITIEFLIAWHRKELFIRDRAKIASKQARNKQLARIFFVPAVVFGVLMTNYSGSFKVAILGLFAGYLLPYSILLTIHFMKNHKEIKKLTNG